jgi:uncharacterized protein YndB with AHSA1/START domain
MAKLTVKVPEKSQNIEGIITIKAPLEKVFKAYTEVDLFKQWFGRGNNVTVHEFKGKSGGSWHVGEKSEDGNTYEFCGSFHEVATNERIIWTFEFLGLPDRGHVAIERTDFIKIDDNTTELRTLSTYQTVADRDGMVKSGMEEGWRQSIETLEKLLNK